MIAELDQNGRLSKYFVYGSKSHVPDYFIDSNNEKFKIITDHLGSVRYVVNSSTGEVKLKMNHDEFGKVLVDTNPNYLPFGFAGGIYDSSTGLVRFGVRDYDAQIARWTSKDPIRFNGGDTNLYGYVLQDPINYIDPKGKWPEWIDDGVCYITGKCNPANPDSPDWADTIKDVIDDIVPTPKPKDPEEPSNQYCK